MIFEALHKLLWPKTNCSFVNPIGLMSNLLRLDHRNTGPVDGKLQSLVFTPVVRGQLLSTLVGLFDVFFGVLLIPFVAAVFAPVCVLKFFDVKSDRYARFDKCIGISSSRK